MAEPAPADPDRQLEELCRVLNHFGVRYVVFGSHVARLNGVAVETVDVDLVPDRERENLDRLAEALNFVRARRDAFFGRTTTSGARRPTRVIDITRMS